MAEETIEQIKERLKREDEEKNKRLYEVRREAEELDAQRERAEAEERCRQEAERQRLEAERSAAEEEREKNRVRPHWIAAGGTAEDFEKAWPDMWRQTLMTRTLEAEAQAQEESRKFYSRIF